MESRTSAGGDGASRMGRRRLVMHLVRGSFFTPAEDAAAASQGVTMDAEVWGELPDEITWKVLLLLPVAKHFQLQLVSRTWRQVLTSAHFRNRAIMMTAAAAPGEREEQLQRPVALVSHAGEDRAISGSSSKVKAVDIDLRGLVPDWFLEPDSYSVVSAGNGLVCVRSSSEYHHFAKLVKPEEDWREAADREWEPTKPWVDRYCVLNPLTRTCVVLPPLPFRSNMYTWYPPVVTGTCSGAGGGAAAFAISVWCRWTREMATYRSGGGDGGTQWRVVAYDPDAPKVAPPVDAVVGGQAYHYDLDEDQVYVVAAEAEEDGAVPVPRWPWRTRIPEEEEEVEGSLILEIPASMTVRGCLWERPRFYKPPPVVVAHRGAIYLLSQLEHVVRARSGSAGCGLWRLGRAGAGADGGSHVHADGRVEWEAVSLLDLAELDGLTDHCSVMVFGLNAIQLGAACRVRELVCFPVEARTSEVARSTSKAGEVRPFCDWLLGFYLDTGNWEVVHHDEDGMACAANGLAMELRPDLFLAP